MDITPIPESHWIPDGAVNACGLCNREFTTFTRRRHHCRFCGRVVCAACCEAQFPTKNHGKQRACLDCIRATSQASSPPSALDATSDDSQPSPIQNRSVAVSEADAMKSVGDLASATPASAPPACIEKENKPEDVQEEGGHFTAATHESQQDDEVMGGNARCQSDTDEHLANPADELLSNGYEEALTQEDNGRLSATREAMEIVDGAMSDAQRNRWLTHESTIEALLKLLGTAVLRWWVQLVEKSATRLKPGEVLLAQGEKIVELCGNYTVHDNQDAEGQQAAGGDGIPFFNTLIETIGLVPFLQMRSENANSVLHVLTRNNRLHLVERIVSLCRDAPATSDGDSMVEDNLAAMTALRKCVRHPGVFGKSVLHMAVDTLGYHNNSHCIAFMELYVKELGADLEQGMSEKETINQPPTKGATALMYYFGISTWFNKLFLELMVNELKADITKVDAYGQNVLHYICGNHLSGDTSHLRLAMTFAQEHGVVDARCSEHDRFALHHACWNGKGKTVHTLLTAARELGSSFPCGLDEYCTHCDVDGDTPLHKTAEYFAGPYKQDCINRICEVCPPAATIPNAKTNEFVKDRLMAHLHRAEEGIRNNMAEAESRFKIGVEGWKWRSEWFDYNWDFNSTNKKSHTDGGLVAVILAVSVNGGERLTTEEVDSLLVVRRQYAKMEASKELRAKEVEAREAWIWSMEESLLKCVVANDDVAERRRLFTERRKEFLEECAARREAAAAAAATEKARVARQDTGTRFVFWSALLAWAVWYWLL